MMLFNLPIKPLLMGALMGPVMLAMMHPMLTGGTDKGAWALLAFVGAHVLALVLLGGLALFAARFAPKLRQRLAGVHRPRNSHLAGMLLGVVVSAGFVHIIVHGGFL